jgi:hypothetical protein
MINKFSKPSKHSLISLMRFCLNSRPFFLVFVKVTKGLDKSFFIRKLLLLGKIANIPFYLFYHAWILALWLTSQLYENILPSTAIFFLKLF